MPRAATKPPPDPLDALVTKINKSLGDGTLVRGSDLKDMAFPRCTTGSLSMDLMLGGGLPLNCWSELVAEPSNGKSVLAMKCVGANQRANPKHHCLWVAAEDVVPAWATTCGMDLDRTTFCQTRIMEEAYQVIIEALDNRLVDSVVVDSLSALTPGEEAEKTMDEWTVGLGARLTNKFMRKSSTSQRRSLSEPDRNCLGIIISQWRDKVGVMWGDTKTTPYGRGKEFHYMVRIEARRDEWLTRGDRKVGIAIKARTIKNKTAPPQRVGNVDFYWEDVHSADGYRQFAAGDYDTVKEVSNIAMALDVVTQRGSYYYYGDEQWHGQAPFLDALREEPDLLAEIEGMVRHMVTGTPLPKSRPRATKTTFTPPQAPKTRRLIKEK